MKHAAANLLGPVLACALLLAIAPPARGGGGETLRWQFERVDGYVYRLSGADATKILPDQLLERTLFAADLRDARAPATPVGRVVDLIFDYAFRLPDDATDAGTTWAVHDVHELPYYIGPIAAEGEGKCLAKKGQAYELRWTAKLALGPNAHHDARFDKGTIAVTAYFHQKKKAIVSAEFAIDWTEKQGNNQPSKPYAFRGTIELLRPIELDARKVRDSADRAVKRGVDILKPYLQKAEYRREDYPLGRLALALFALEKAGIEPGDSLLKQGFDDFERFPPLAEKGGSAETYSVALAIMALEGKSVRRAKEKTSGTRIRYEKGDLVKVDLDRLEKLTRWLLEARDPSRCCWSYRSWKERKPNENRFGDGSNTQFAVLALHAASRAGVKVSPEVFKQIANTYLSYQEGGGPMVMPALEFEQGAWLAPQPDGTTGDRIPELQRARGWYYDVGPGWNEGAYASMTAGSVSSLLICREELAKAKALDQELAARIECGIRDGFAWLQRRHEMRANWPDYGGWPLYHCYALEKAFEIGRVERIARHDWWGEGAIEIIIREKTSGAYAKQQAAAGTSMPGGWGSNDQTALAILFLTRASTEPEIDVRDPGRGATGETAAEDALTVVVENLGAVNAREVVLATEVRDAEKRRERLELAEKACTGVPEDRRPLLVPALGRLLESSYPECARFGAKWLRAIAGDKVADRAAADGFYARWEELTRQGLADDPAAIPGARERLRDPLPGVRRAAALALSRLRAVEAVPELINAMAREEKENRAYMRAILAGILGSDGGDDPKAWQRAWEAAQKDLIAREDVRRAVRTLGRPDARDAARTKLLAVGKPAVRALIDGLQRDDVRPEAARLLEEITGKDLGGDRDAWEKWWREGGGA